MHTPTVLILSLITAVTLSARAASLADQIDAGPYDVIVAQVKQDPGSVNAPDEYGFTPLHRAVTSNRTDKQAVVEFLLKSGANPNAKSTKAGTVIQHAIAAGDVKTVKALLEAGADLNLAGEDEVSSLERIAWVNDNAGVVELFELIKTKAPQQIAQHGSDALLQCVDRVNVDYAALLVSKGVDPHKPDAASPSAFLVERLKTEEDPEIKGSLLKIQKAFGDTPQ